MNGHAITAWLAVLYRRIGKRSRESETGLLKARQSKPSVYCIRQGRVLVAAARSRMGLRAYVRVHDTELCDMGMGKI